MIVWAPDRRNGQRGFAGLGFDSFVPNAIQVQLWANAARSSAEALSSSGTKEPGGGAPISAVTRASGLVSDPWLLPVPNASQVATDAQAAAYAENQVAQYASAPETYGYGRPAVGTVDPWGNFWVLVQNRDGPGGVAFGSLGVVPASIFSSLGISSVNLNRAQTLAVLSALQGVQAGGALPDSVSTSSAQPAAAQPAATQPGATQPAGGNAVASESASSGTAVSSTLSSLPWWAWALGVGVVLFLAMRD